MRFLATTIIGFFFATCMLLILPLYIFFPLPLLLPFVGGFVFSWGLRRRGWFTYLAPRVTVIHGGLAILASIFAPVLVGIFVNFLEVQRLELPEEIIDLRRSIGPGRFHLTFLAPAGINDLKAHFRECHGIKYWNDRPTPDTTDDPDTLAQSESARQLQQLWILLSDHGEQTFVEIGGPHSRPEPVYFVAGGGLLILISMIALGPPHMRNL